jgi:hypothetical protein
MDALMQAGFSNVSLVTEPYHDGRRR